jgi:hypothetical protein
MYFVLFWMDQPDMRLVIDWLNVFDGAGGENVREGIPS